MLSVGSSRESGDSNIAVLHGPPGRFASSVGSFLEEEKVSPLDGVIERPGPLGRLAIRPPHVTVAGEVVESLLPSLESIPKQNRIPAEHLECLDTRKQYRWSLLRVQEQDGPCFRDGSGYISRTVTSSTLFRLP